MRTEQATRVLAYLWRLKSPVELTGVPEAIRDRLEELRRRVDAVEQPGQYPDPVAEDALVDELYRELGAVPPRASAVQDNHPLWVVLRDPDADAEAEALDTLCKELEESTGAASM